MTDEQASAAAEVGKVDAQTQETDSQQQAPDLEAERKQLSDRLAQQGRELKAARDEKDRLQSELSTAKAERERIWYEKEASPEEKVQYVKDRDTRQKEAPKIAMLENRSALAEAIADETDPAIRKALQAFKSKGKETGKYPDAEFVASLRESLRKDDSGAENLGNVETEKPLPRVSAVRGTRGVEPSIDDQIAVAEKSVKAKDGRFTYGDVLNLRFQKSQQSRQAQ
jgi:hypothetical protein